MNAKRRLLVAASLVFAGTTMAHAQTPPYPPAGYSPLLFDSVDTKHVFRLNGTPWICRGDSFCKTIKIDGAVDKDMAQATIESLGSAGARYLLAYRQANFEKGKDVVLSCSEERCSKLDSITGPANLLGTYQIKHGDRVLTRSAFVRQLDAKNGRAQLMWCSETDCSELPLTRDSELYLALLGRGQSEGHSAAWLRDKQGNVLSCAQPEAGVSDQLTCEKTRIILSDFPVAAAPPAPPPPSAPPAPTTSDAERNALSASIDRAITSGDFVTADRLLADATRRYAGYAAWPSLQQKLARARADRDLQSRQAEARRLIADARRFAQAGDFAHAEAMLQDADKQMPAFAETQQVRAEIAALRTQRGQRYRDRREFAAAIDQALAADRLWEAERMLADYAQRYSKDDDYLARSRRLAELRGAGPYQARLAEARAHIASARQAMARNDFGEADRQLALADQVAPGFPEIAQAHADLSRRRIAQPLPDDLRQLLAAIDTAMAERHYGDAERMIADGTRRYPSYTGWPDLSRRLADARRGPPPQTGILPPLPSGPRSQ
jgi:hypothetical protein